MKNFYSHFIKISIFSFCLFFSLAVVAQSQPSRKEIALQKAEDRVESYRLKLVSLKQQIESADSLFVAGEVLEEKSKILRFEARDEMKNIEKKYKSESKAINKRVKSKDRGVSSDARAELKGVTTKYRLDIKEAKAKLRTGEKGATSSVRMMDKADKKLDALAEKLRTAEKAYVNAENVLNEKKGIKKK